jgi:hypothetical protein
VVCQSVMTCIWGWWRRLAISNPTWVRNCRAADAGRRAGRTVIGTLRRNCGTPRPDHFTYELCGASPSQSQPELPAQIPLDAAVAHDAGDVLADPLIEDRPPRHQAKSEPVVDHGVAPADEIGRLPIGTCPSTGGRRDKAGAATYFQQDAL